MPAPPKDWIALTAKLERAEHHIFALREFWGGFIKGGAYPILSQDAWDGSHRMYYLGSVAPIPADVPLIVGDAIHNLRSALDHLAYRLVSVGKQSPGPFKRIYFPIAKSPIEFEAKIRDLKKCLTPSAVSALTKVEAFLGGTGEIYWHIHRLNIIDKHRLLLTVTSQNRLRSMSPGEIAKIRSMFLGVLENIPEANDPKMFLKSGIRHLSLETDHVLDILPISEVHETMHFPIELAFGESEVNDKPVVEMLQQAATIIRNLFMVFDNSGLLE